MLKSKYHIEGFTFKGFFDMPLEHYKIIEDYFLETGTNLVDSYCEVIYLSWRDGSNTEFMVDSFQRDYYSECISKVRSLRIPDFDEIREANYVLDKEYKNFLDYKEFIYQKPRREAQKYISKKDVRDAVFKLYGKICLCCGTDKNISIDHINPVFKGGKNELKNLQPLCKSCNSRKGTKYIDYRNG